MTAIAKKGSNVLGRVALTLVLACAFGSWASSAEYWLVAKPFNKTVGSASIPMWGFEKTDADFVPVAGGAPDSPGPVLAVAAGDTSLTVHLKNELPEPVSIVVHATGGALQPTFVSRAGQPTGTGSRPAGDYSSVVRSFTPEAAPNGGTADYTFQVRPGTFLYTSGSHPAVQVQMGLYGAVTALAPAGEAYAGIAIDNQALFVFSEIDPALHQAVAAQQYGQPPYTSTIEYKPKYFLINGAVYPNAGPILDHDITLNERVLVRLVNAGLRNRVPLLVGAEFELIARDGFLAPTPHRQYSVYLNPGQTQDALFQHAVPGLVPLFDRMMGTTNDTAAPGGMIAYLAVNDTGTDPIAYDDQYVATEDASFDEPAPGVLVNDNSPASNPLTAELVSGVSHGSLQFNADGSFAYTPAANFFGFDAFTYRAVDGTAYSNTATVSIEVTNVSDLPVATNDTYNGQQDTPLDVAAPGVLANDSDVDGDTLTAQLDAQPNNGSVALEANGSFRYTPVAGFFGADSFTYVALAPDGSSAPATVTIDVAPKPNSPPVANNDIARTRRNTPVTIPVLNNDTDSDGTLVPGSVQVSTNPRNGTAVANPDGTVTYTPRLGFRGTDSFRYTVRDNKGALSNAALVIVNVTR